MKNKKLFTNIEKAQILPLIAVALLVLIMLAALILDGGAIMSYRRAAQAAADAGALAGATEICWDYDLNKTPLEVAEDYAQKNVTTSVYNIDASYFTDKEVKVFVELERPSFLANIFGEPTLKASADAVAGCYGVRGKGVVPIAWYCRPNSTTSPNYSAFDNDYSCQMQTLVWDDIRPLIEGETSSISLKDTDGTFTYNLESKNTNKTISRSIVRQVSEDRGEDGLFEGLKTPNQIYILWDSEKICLEDKAVLIAEGTWDETNAIQCDMDGDGKKDLLMGGDQGLVYLTLDNTPVQNWIDYGGAYPDTLLQDHMWVKGKSGEVATVIGSMLSPKEGLPFPGQVVKVPVYNEICHIKDGETRAGCVAEAHGSPWNYTGPCIETAFTETTNENLYHILAFANFYVSCTSSEGDCPGYQYASSFLDEKDLPNKPSIVEGFFVTGYDSAADTTADCMFGNCIVSLVDPN